MIQVDRRTMIQILGSLMLRPNFLDDTDKYQFDPSDFSQTLDKFIFSAIYNLYINGATSIHTIDVDNYLQSNAEAKTLLQKENGIVFLQDCEAYAEPDNFGYYYNKFKKINLLRELQRGGKDISKIYSENPLDDDYTKINNRFEKLTTTDIINELKGEIASLENKFVLNSVVDESNAYEGVRDLVEELSRKPEVGTPLQGEIFNTIVRGGRHGKLYLRSASSGSGKALPNYTKIPTPDGWKAVGEVEVGDYLFDRLGKPTKVLAVYPQQEKKQVYKVYFKSGRIAECCSEHLWSYYDNSVRNKNVLHTKTLKEILNDKRGLKRGQAYRFSVPICQPVSYEKKEYPIPPYIMGLALGDGSFRIQASKVFYYTSADEELVKEIKEQMGYDSYKKKSKSNYSWYFLYNEEDAQKHKHFNVQVLDFLKAFPDLVNVKSDKKWIPSQYLKGSIEQRFDLLAGLLDTDGTIDKKGRISYGTTSLFLRDDIIQLCHSLGLTTHLTIEHNKKYTTGVFYRVIIKGSKEQKIKMFKLKRKKEIALNYLFNNKKAEKRDRDPIVKIEATDRYTDMTCFYVDNEEHLFLMNNFICTHNTRSMVGDAAHIAYPCYFDIKKNEWVSTGQCEKVLYIMTEQDPAEIQTMLLAYLTGYDESIFLYGTFGEEHKERIKIALKIMEDYKDNLLFARVADPCASVVKNLFRRYALQQNVEYFFFDYIFSSPAMLNEYRDLKLAEHVCLRLFTTALKNLAIELNVFIMTATQTSNDDDLKNGGFHDYHNVAGSRSIINLVDFACIMSRPTAVDLTEAKSKIGFNGKEPNLITDVFKNRRGRWNMIRIWSYMDLSTCHKTDLFISNPNNTPTKDSIEPINITAEISPEIQELLDYLNNGVVSDEKAEEILTMMEQEEPEQIFGGFLQIEEKTEEEKVQDAFGHEEELKERYKNLSIGDML